MGLVFSLILQRLENILNCTAKNLLIKFYRVLNCLHLASCADFTSTLIPPSPHCIWQIVSETSIPNSFLPCEFFTCSIFVLFLSFLPATRQELFSSIRSLLWCWCAVSKQIQITRPKNHWLELLKPWSKTGIFYLQDDLSEVFVIMIVS